MQQHRQSVRIQLGQHDILALNTRFAEYIGALGGYFVDTSTRITGSGQLLVHRDQIDASELHGTSVRPGRYKSVVEIIQEFDREYHSLIQEWALLV